MPRDLPNTNQIQLYLHCALCLAEHSAGKAPDTSPATYARLSVGWTVQGLQVWCDRHDVNVMHVDFEGHKHPANLTRRDS